MKKHTSAFKENIKLLGRQQDSKVYFLIGDTKIEIDSEQINSVTPHFEGDILKSVMKVIEIDSNINIPKNTVLNYKYGLLVNGQFEYLDFGNYIVRSSEKQEDYNSYKIVAYDKLLFSMVNYDDIFKLNPISYPITINKFINLIAEKIGLKFKNKDTNFSNYNRQITKELYLNQGYTIRDVLDELAQVVAGTICISKDDELEIRYIKETKDVIDEEYLKDINVNFGQKYGPVNSIVLSRSADSDTVYLRDEDSIEKNGLCEIKISDNQIMNWNDRADYLPDILNRLNGLEYYINDFTSTGIVYYDLCDRYTVKIGENNYSCVMLNDEIDVTQGLQELIHTDLPEKSETDYTKSDKTDRKINQTYLIVDKQNQEITALVSKTDDLNTKTSQLRLDVDKIEGQISDVADITTTVEGTGTLTVDNINESEPIYLKIYPLNKDFSYLYPEDNLYPDEDLYPLTRQILFKNTSENYQVEYEIPDDLLFYSKDIYDEFILDYDNQACYIIKRVGYQKTKINIEVGNDLSNAYLGLNLNNLQSNIIYIQSNNYRIIEKYTSAEDTITLEKLEDSIWNKVDNLYIYNNQTNEVTLNLKNYTLPSDFGIVTEIYESRFDNVNDYIQVEKIGNKIPLGTEQRIDYPYPHIPLKAGNYEISLLTQETAYLYVRLMIQNLYTDQFATKVEMNSKITQTANEINAEVSKKVGNDEVISKINLTPETATIQANKVNINGVITAINNDTTTTINGNKITTGTLNADVINGGTMSGSSINLGNGNFTVDTAGNMKASTGKIGTWDINTVGIFAKDSNNKYSGLRLPQNESKAYSFFAGADSSTGANAKFVAYSDGQLYAQNADIAGKITATSGTIAGFIIGSNRLYYGNTAINRNGNVEFKNDNGYLAIGTNGVQLNGNGAERRISISDLLGNSSTGDVNATVGIRAFNGNLRLRSNYYTVVSGDQGVYIQNQFFASSSSKGTKENIKSLEEQKINKIYNVIKNMPFYTFDYKEKYSGRKTNVGFIIEDIENTILGDYLHIYKSEDDKNYKNYNSEDLTRIELVVIQEMMKKIDILENKVSNLEKQLKNVNIENRKD